jgi:ABC-type phosphate transport system substrate-binding protein
MRMVASGLSLALLSFCFLGLAGCGEDNEAAIKEQASKAKGTIPGSRTAQAQTQEEYYEITPGVQGVGTAGGPRPDRGIAGYPRAPK